MAQTEEHRLIERLYRRATALFVLSAFTTVGVLFLLDDATSLAAKIGSVASGVAASIIYTLLFTFIAARDQRELYQSQISREFNRHAEILNNEISRMAPDYLPSAQYPGTPAFDARFNHDLMKDIATARTYLFRGASAKYVSARMLESGTRMDLIRVLVGDPTLDQSLRRRAVDRKSNPKYAHKDYASILLDLKSEVIMSVVALFEIRRQTRVEIALLENDPSVARIEALDDCCYVSLFHTIRSDRFPETLRYDSGSILSDLFRLECIRQFEDAPKKLSFGPYDDDADLISKLQSVGISSVDHDKLAEMRVEFKTFSDEFRAKLRDI